MVYLYLTELFEINVYMYKNGFGINNLQWLMCHETKPNQTKIKAKICIKVKMINKKIVK